LTKTYIRQGKHNQIRAVGKINPKPPFLGNIAYARCAQGIGHASFFESVYHGAEKDEIGMPYAPPTGLMRETEDIFLKNYTPYISIRQENFPMSFFRRLRRCLQKRDEERKLTGRTESERGLLCRARLPAKSKERTAKPYSMPDWSAAYFHG